MFVADFRGTPVAIKRVDMPLEFGNTGSRDAADVIQFFMEVLVLLKLRHPHLLHLNLVSFAAEVLLVVLRGCPVAGHPTSTLPLTPTRV